MQISQCNIAMLTAHLLEQFTNALPRLFLQISWKVFLSNKCEISIKILQLITRVHSVYTHVKTHDLFLPVDRLQGGWAGQLEHGCWQACSCMLEQTDHGLMNKQTWTTLLEPSRQMNSHVHTWLNMLSGNDEITKLNTDVTTTMYLAVVSSLVLHVLTYTNNPCRFTKLYTICWNMIEQYML